jgi:hypothetical protein
VACESSLHSSAPRGFETAHAVSDRARRIKSGTHVGFACVQGTGTEGTRCMECSQQWGQMNYVATQGRKRRRGGFGDDRGRGRRNYPFESAVGGSVRRRKRNA